jgi:hypothetical protein
MKKIFLFIPIFLLLFSCAKISKQIKIEDVMLFTTNENVSVQTSSANSDCSIENCTGDTTSSIYGCHLDHTPCSQIDNPPFIESIGVLVDGLDVQRIIKKPTRPASDESLTACLSNLNASLLFNANGTMTYNIRQIGKPDILFQKTLGRISVYDFRKAGDVKLAVTNLALDTYKKYPTQINRKIVLQQVFNQLTTSYHINR